MAACTAPTLFAARDRSGHWIRHGRRQGHQPSRRHPPAEGDEARAAVRHARQVGQELLADDALSRLREQPRVIPLGDQAAASVTRPSGRRYIESVTTGWTFFLFVRPDPDATFAFL